MSILQDPKRDPLVHSRVLEHTRHLFPEFGLSIPVSVLMSLIGSDGVTVPSLVYSVDDGDPYW